VEIDPLACVQARENVLRSPWPDRIRLYNESFQEFSKHTDIKYDLIVSNPPYFEESVLPDEHTRINARHTVSLNYDDIFRCSADILAATGRISLIFPFSMEEQVEKSAMRQGFFPIRKTYVSGTPRSLPKRILEEWGRYESLYESDSLVIEEKRHSYTPEYIDLTRDFYLKM
jgi:tRNA (adenine-N(6)-)-methyltransferase